MIDVMLSSGVLHTLVGFGTSKQGSGSFFNFVLSNGAKSQQRDVGMTYYNHMMPEGSHKRIKSVEIYHGSDIILGFVFFDKHQKLIFKIGEIRSWDKVKTLVLADD